VLIVEDEAALRLGLSDRLESEGYEVAAAADGEEGFALAREGASTPRCSCSPPAAR
jgi:CheY-like chemotaxis protein